jgi:uncharacterized protein
MTMTQIHPIITPIIDQITQKFYPIQIILFGSYAKGHPDPDSDLDLIVILHFEGRNIDKSVEILSALDPYPDIPIDLITYKPDEITRRYQEGDPFIHEAYTSGIILYDQNNR